MKKQPKPTGPTVIETFSDPTWAVQNFRHDAASCFNGRVSIERYRVTIEKIDEPIEVLRDRLRRLWREKEYNSHDSGPMKAKAKELDFVLDDNERAVEFRARRAMTRTQGGD